MRVHIGKKMQFKHPGLTDFFLSFSFFFFFFFGGGGGGGAGEVKMGLGEPESS